MSTGRLKMAGYRLTQLDPMRNVTRVWFIKDV
jgi:hypothetical protein